MLFDLSALASICIVLVATGLLLRICWTDFFLMKIWNTDLLILLAFGIASLIITRPDDLGLRIGLAGLLFGLSFVFWIFKTLGAGDVKLFGVVGLLIEPQHLLVFVLLNMVFVALIHLGYQYASLLRFVPQIAGRRMLALAATGRIPYGVAISLSAIALLLHSLIRIS